MSLKNHARALILVGLSSLVLTSCAELIVVGAATGAVATQDQRTIPTQLEDENIEIKTVNALFKNDELWKDTNIDVLSFNNILLLIGQAPTAKLKQKAGDLAENIAKVRKVYNQIKISAPISFFARRNDEYLTTKVKSKMLFADNFPSGKIKVVTENSEVFLLGLVSQDEADKAAEIAKT
ncbi:MAG: BON domain-containing protein [Enterobacterales bacterium]|nr:BON domain-containing protein [Enterobacterales bacterium]